jgi:urease accessory protein
MAGGDIAFVHLLQLADGGFPSGAYVLSHGLETLIADGAVRDGADLGTALRVSLLGRLARADLPVLLAVHDIAVRWGGGTEFDAEAGVAALVELDRGLATVKLAREEREGSVRVGRRLALETERLLDSAALVAMREAIEAGLTPGNAAVVHGLAMAAVGVGRREAGLAVASSFAISFVTAAVRLGRIGHGEAQRLVHAAAVDMALALDIAESVDPTDLRPSAPQLDIAAARHERADVRTFAS